MAITADATDTHRDTVRAAGVVMHKPRIPRLASGIDVRALPLSPLEGFVLSRVDGVASLGDIADLTNQSTDDCATVLERLFELHAIEWTDGVASLPRATSRVSMPNMARMSGDPPSRPSALPKGSQVEETRARPDGRSEPPPARPGARHGILERTQSLAHQPTELPPRGASEPPDPVPFAPTHPAPPRTGPNGSDPLPSVPSFPPSAGAATGGVPSFSPSAASSPGASSPAASAASSSAGSSPAAPAAAATPVPPDDLEITPERRRRIDDLWIALDLLNHYELLGVSQKASRQEIRGAYFELSKAFHPDTAFRKKVGTYRSKMEAIFKRLTEAYEVLGKQKPRAEYDTYLASIGEAKDAEEALSNETEITPEMLAASAPSEPTPVPTAAAPSTAGPTPAPARSPSSQPPAGLPTASKSSSGTMPAVRDSAPPSAPPRVVSEESRRRAAELFQRRLEGARAESRPRTSPGAVPAEAPRTREEMARELKSVIHSSAVISGSMPNGPGSDAIVAQQLADARRAEAQGELTMAVRALRIALAAAPERADVAEEHERVAKLLAISLADRYSDQATYEERHKKWQAAAITWAKVLEGRPDDLTALLGASVCLLEAKGDLRKAQRFAQRAADLHPNDGNALRILARVCIGAGLPLNARRALQQALAIDPGDVQAQTLLATLPARHSERP